MRMTNVRLTRIAESDAGTEGVLQAGEFICKTLELPWRGNVRARSCVPTGSYLAKVVWSPRFGRVYGLFGTAPRSHILIHAGNYAGDIDKGLRTHVQGCILLGRYFGQLGGQRAVLVSRPTVREFMQHMGGAPFTLIIEDHNADVTDRNIE